MNSLRFWTVIASTIFLSGCSLFESPAIETPHPTPLPDGRALIGKSLDQLLHIPQGTFQLTSDLQFSSPNQQDKLALNLNGQFDHTVHALRGQGTLTIDLPTDNELTTEHTRGIANIDSVATNDQFLVRLISTHFSGPDSDKFTTTTTPLSNTWFTIPGSNQYWPVQKIIAPLFPKSNDWSLYTQYLQIDDIALVQMPDEKAYQIAVSLDKEKLIAYLDSGTNNLDANVRESYRQFISLLSWQANLFLSQSSGDLKSLSGTITLQGHLHNDTTVEVKYKLDIASKTLSAPISVPAINQVIDSQKLGELLGNSQ